MLTRKRTPFAFVLALAALALTAVSTHAATIGHPTIDGGPDTLVNAGFIMINDPIPAGTVTDFSFYSKISGTTITPLIFDGALQIIGVGTTRTTTTAAGVEAFAFDLVSGSAAVGPGTFLGWQPGSGDISPVAFNTGPAGHVRYFTSPTAAGLGDTASGGANLARIYSIEFNTIDDAPPPPPPSGSTELKVDFQHTGTLTAGVTQAGFEAFDQTDGGSATYSTAGGDVTVTMAGLDGGLGGHLTRGGVTNGGALTFEDVYDDFAFKNIGGPGDPAGSGSMTLTLFGDGIDPNTAYELTFYSYDDHGSQGSHSVVYTGISGTTGATGPLTWTGGVDPTSNSAYAVTGTFTSDGSGLLTIDMTDTWTGATDTTGIRLNAFELAAVSVIPAPAALPAGLALLGLAAMRRRRS